ncbi:MAG: hypothetical protein P4L66_00405 [Acetobacteraceae bacterium]|nr:hypothetical protein [Acetobacteraceae bacterium]
MTAHASPIRLIGPQLPQSNVCMSETGQSYVLLIGGPTESLAGYEDVCQGLDLETMAVASHHELPFRLHHFRPMAVLIDLPSESRALAATLRCIAAYNPDLPSMLIADDNASALGTMDAARALWGLARLGRLPRDVSSRALIPILFRAGRARGVGRLLPAGR